MKYQVGKQVLLTDIPFFLPPESTGAPVSREIPLLPGFLLCLAAGEVQWKGTGIILGMPGMHTFLQS